MTPESFWSRVEKTDGCWLWRGPKKPNGYGNVGFRFAGRATSTKAHRFAFALEYGRQPSGELHHTCEVKACVNPAHLVEATAHRQHMERHWRERPRCGHVYDSFDLNPGNWVARRCRRCQRETQRRYEARKRLTTLYAEAS